MPTLIQAIAKNPTVNAFRRVWRGSENVRDWRFENVRDWQFEPSPGDVVANADRDGFYVIAAMNIISERDVYRCYMDVSLPKRINTYAYFISGDELRYDQARKFEGEIIPAIAIDGLGVYDLFYSRIAPELGIGVLKRGLAASKRKHFIAEDLGYIFRDEGRYREAAAMFQLAADEEVSSYFLYGELAQMYGKIGEAEKQKKYAELFRQ